MPSPRILFVHGAAADARLWEPVISALPGDWKAEAITLTYFGNEPWPDDGKQFGTRLHATELRERAESMGGDIHLVCWSYAVHVGLQAMLDAPKTFASALFYEAGLGHYITDAEERAAFEKDAGSCFGAVGAKLANDSPQASVRQLVGSAFAALPSERQAIYLDNARMMPLLMGGGEAPTKIGPAELARIGTPCHVVMGARTRPCFAIPSRALARGLPSADLDVIEGADHFLPEMKPDLFAGLVEEWIAP